jgi:hypothetical protein
MDAKSAGESESRLENAKIAYRIEERNNVTLKILNDTPQKFLFIDP